MYKIQSVKAKLNFILLFTLVGGILLFISINLFINKQSDFRDIDKTIQIFNSSIVKYYHNIDLFASKSVNRSTKSVNSEYILTRAHLKKLQDQILSNDLDIKNLLLLDKHLINSKVLFDKLANKQKQLNENILKMRKASSTLNTLFNKHYEYKLIQYMMSLELMEKTFLEKNTIDLKKFRKIQFKMRRSVRASESFTTNKQLQQQINNALADYKKMMSLVVEIKKEIGFTHNEALRGDLYKSFLKTSKLLNQNSVYLENDINEKENMLLTILLSLIAIGIIIQAVFINIISKGIISSLNIVKNGLDYFFEFINYEKEYLNPLEINTNDEFKYMVDQINENIQRTIKTFEQNRLTVEEASDIIQKVSTGFYSYQIKSRDGISPDMTILVDNINIMISQTHQKLEVLGKTMEAFGKYEFNYDIDKEANDISMYGDLGSLVTGLKLIGNNVSEFLAMIHNTGQELNSNTSILNDSSTQLSDASLSQATSLEETAGALEEITNGIKLSTEDTIQMEKYAKELQHSSQEGNILATQTAESMEDINHQVLSIRKAIEVIDQISFQTNVLSLNAAVEAATAGEAGKGFAVVAQEVRDLASRSAEAANEIKALVEHATSKAINGKGIANDMIAGYQTLNDKLTNTIGLINNVSKASLDQSSKISQINNSVMQLDQNTQINASNSQNISDLSHQISNMANGLVSAASRAKFKEEALKQVCDTEMVYTTAHLKHQQIAFKHKNFRKLGTYDSWKVANIEDRHITKWIKEQETKSMPFTNTQEWSKLKDNCLAVHNDVQKFIDMNNQKVDNKILEELACRIENDTLKLFDMLNEIKVLHCKTFKDCTVNCTI